MIMLTHEQFLERLKAESCDSGHKSSTVVENIEYMYKKYGFFVPDTDYLIDNEGLIGYCAEKVKLGRTCLYCQRIFKTWEGCQKHMINTRHTKLCYQPDVDLEEYDVFYDFSTADEEFLQSGIANHRLKKKVGHQKFDYLPKYGNDQSCQDNSIDIEVEDEDEWQDVESTDYEVNVVHNDIDDGFYAAYQDEITKHGFDITPLGEWVFPDGRIIGHRGLVRYYKQRFTPEDNRASILVAKKSNCERLYRGRLYNTHTVRGDGQEKQTALVMAKTGLSLIRRQGKGILVSSGSFIDLVYVIY